MSTPDLAAFAHHLTLHFPIVLTLTLGALGEWSRRQDGDPARGFVRAAGWVAVALATVAVISGTIAASDQPSPTVDHHRWLGWLTWAAMLCAASAYEASFRPATDHHPDWRVVGVGLWWTAALACVGAGHWGGLSIHERVIPW